MPSPVPCKLEVCDYQYFTRSGHIAHPFLDIPADQVTEFDFWVQYASAAYYLNDYTAQTGYKISCAKGNCPDVEKNGATIFYDFSK